MGLEEGFLDVGLTVGFLDVGFSVVGLTVGFLDEGLAVLGFVVLGFAVLGFDVLGMDVGSGVGFTDIEKKDKRLETIFMQVRSIDTPTNPVQVPTIAVC